MTNYSTSYVNCLSLLLEGGLIIIKIKRIYQEPEVNDDFRILVDRLWPRGLTKQKAKVDLWQKEIAPSNELRQWFHHDPAQWSEFKNRYFKELESKQDSVKTIVEKSRNQDITLLFSAKNEEFNNAVALKEYIEQKRYSG
ncbi:MAG: DUF488 domain-containing protein [Candidatus Helarchaeota archaeon]|nr:DUF488 domain-containing protein [Candidatus Helarchaeota archaeon]